MAPGGLAVRVLPALLAGLVAAAAALEPLPPPKSPVGALSPPLRAAFLAEMRQIEAGLQRVVSAAATGDWHAVEEAANRIRGSFILERDLTEEQRAELHRSLPAGFLELDRRFHETAGRLASAARAADAELVTFWAYRLNESCVACHSRWAAERFTGLKPTAGGDAHGAVTPGHSPGAGAAGHHETGTREHLEGTPAAHP